MEAPAGTADASLLVIAGEKTMIRHVPSTAAASRRKTGRSREFCDVITPRCKLKSKDAVEMLKACLQEHTFIRAWIEIAQSVLSATKVPASLADEHEF